MGRSPATLHTVSALMPYRSEFKTAGLAVTSKDQGNRIHSYITKAVEAGAPEEAVSSRKIESRKAATGKPPQVDGFDNTEPSDSPDTEMDFAPSNGMDEWRYAMIDEIPASKKKKKKKTAANGKKTKKHCLSCFDNSPSTATEGDWAHFRKQPTAPVPRLHGTIGPPPAVPPPPVPPQRPPRPAVGLFDQDPTSQAAPDNMTSTSHFLSPRMLPPRKHAKDRGKYPEIPRRGSPHPRILPSQPKSPPRKQSQASPRRTTRASRPIPHDPTSKQYVRTMRQASPLDLKQAVEDAKNSQKPRKRSSVKLPQGRGGETIDLDHIGICCRSTRGLPSRANARPNIPRRTSSMSQFMFSPRLDFDEKEITDRDVLRGLHIATSAACDEEVDAFVKNQTGLRIRRFLADLMTLETLPVNPPVDKKQWARQRRADMRKLKQQMRRSREISTLGRTNYL